MTGKLKWTREMDADADKLRAEGLTWNEIGERIGCSGKAAGIRYYKRHKPVHTPAAETPEPQPTVSVVTAAPEQSEPAEAADLSPKPELPKEITDADYPGLLRLWAELLFAETCKTDKTAKTARTLMLGAANRYDALLARKTADSEPTHAVLYGIYNDLYLHADHIATLIGLLQLVHGDAGSGAERYDALMDRLAVLLDMLAAAPETLDAVSGRLGDVIKNQPQSGNSTAD